VTGAAWAVCACVVCGLAASGCGAQGGSASEAASEATAVQRVPVVLTPAQTRAFEERVVVQGNVQAKNTALVAPRLPGVLTNLFVDEGDMVVANETALFQTDKVMYEEALKASEQDLAMARCQQREAEINLDRMKADFEKAEIDYERFKRLREKDAVTLNAMEMQESRYKQTKAGLEYARSTVDLAKEQVRKAEAGLAIAKKTLSDSLEYAPISGRVSYKMKEEGEFQGAGEPVFKIDDLSVLEVSAFVPGSVFPRVTVGETPIRVSVYGIDAGELVLSYKSPTIMPQLRTFEVRALIEDPPDGVVPGAIAEIALLLNRFQGVGVPSRAIQERGGKPVVFVVENETAHEVAVETGIETDGWTEVRAEAIADGTPVVSMGQFLVEDGTAVAVQKEES